MTSQRSPRYPAEQWQAWINEQAASGLSQRVFCQRRGLSKSSFYLWKRRLKTAATTSPDTEPALFAPVMPPEREESHRDTRGWDVELDLGDGICLRLRRGGR